MWALIPLYILIHGLSLALGLSLEPHHVLVHLSLPHGVNNSSNKLLTPQQSVPLNLRLRSFTHKRPPGIGLGVETHLAPSC